MFGLKVRVERVLSEEETRRVVSFLERHALKFEGIPEATVLVEDDNGTLIATGSLEGNVIKMVAVEPEWQGANLSSLVLSRLIEEARMKGRHHLFIYTKPDMADHFASFGFLEIARVEPHVVLMEMGEPGIEAYRDYLRKNRREVSSAGAIVMNCNPFTKGHRHLLERAAAECGVVYAIVVEADLSLFPFEDRFRLVSEGTRDLENVVVLRSGDYAVSQATFPSYFLRDADSLALASIQTRLDVTLFANLFVPELKLEARFVGTEPYCETTLSYNEAMKEILPRYGVRVVEIPRLEYAPGKPVSAMTVRECIRLGDWDTVKNLVPDVTWAYLQSPKGRLVAERIAQSHSRH